MLITVLTSFFFRSLWVVFYLPGLKLDAFTYISRQKYIFFYVTRKSGKGLTQCKISMSPLGKKNHPLFVLVIIVLGKESKIKSKILESPPEQEVRVNLHIGALGSYILIPTSFNQKML